MLSGDNLSSVTTLQFLLDITFIIPDYAGPSVGQRKQRATILCHANPLNLQVPDSQHQYKLKDKTIRF